jgi:hypothetical protein
LFDTLANSALAREKIIRWLARFHPGMAVPEGKATVGA